MRSVGTGPMRLSGHLPVWPECGPRALSSDGSASRWRVNHVGSTRIDCCMLLTEHTRHRARRPMASESCRLDSDAVSAETIRHGARLRMPANTAKGPIRVGFREREQETESASRERERARERIRVGFKAAMLLHGFSCEGSVLDRTRPFWSLLETAIP